MKNWTPDKRYTDIYFARADNEKEYIQLAKDLYAEFEVIKSFSCDQWTDKEHLFDNDVYLWHELFETDCLNNEIYEDIDLPNPQDFDGEIEKKPDVNKYPVVLIFQNMMNGKFLSWYSLK